MPDVRERTITTPDGVDLHLTEAGDAGPLVVLSHGFPELAYSWRHQIPALAEAGYHVLAPDQRGYGRTTGWDGSYDGDLAPYGMLNLVQDCLALLSALRIKQCHVVGHDFGSPEIGRAHV